MRFLDSAAEWRCVPPAKGVRSMPRAAAFEAHHERDEAWFESMRSIFSALLALRPFVPQGGRGLEIGMGSGWWRRRWTFRWGSMRLVPLRVGHYLRRKRTFQADVDHPLRAVKALTAFMLSGLSQSNRDGGKPTSIGVARSTGAHGHPQIRLRTGLPCL